MSAAALWVAACGDNIEGSIDAGDDSSECTPVDDGQECTEDVCEAGVPVHNPVTAGTTCTGGACDADGNCVAAPSCTDDTLNGDETDVDCGGSCAPASTCDTDEGCVVAADCTSGVCGTDGLCDAAECGDGVTQTGESCDDGNQTNGDGCDDGVGGTCRPSGCGNGTTTGTEECDDGNVDNGDGCDNNCTTTACGNEITAGAEQCDDGNTDPDDGCDASCAVETGYTCTATVPSVCSTTCGDGIPAGTEGCDDNDLDDGDGCSAVCAVEPGYSCTGTPSVCVENSTCGNGDVEGSEGCDDGGHGVGDGCSAICTVEPGYDCTGEPSTCVNLCGNGTTDAGEECDDGNTTDLDGCSAACTDEATEIEPNEDGTPEIGGDGVTGNDFDATAVMNADANGAFDLGGGPANVTAALTPVGDEDVFAITNSASTPVTVQFDIWNTTTGYGDGVACGTSIDTVLTIRSAAGDLLAQNDDRNGSADRCSTLSYALAAGATVYAHVSFYDDDTTAAGYGLVMTSAPVYCGDSVQVPGLEQCDDGNSAGGDGCSATCTVEGLTEVEPNEDGATATGGSGVNGNDFDTGGIAVANSTAQGVTDVATTGATWLAAITPAGDEDAFAVTNGGAVPVQVTVDTHDLNIGLNRPCTAFDTGLTVRDAAGAIVQSNDQRATGDNCSRVTFILDPGASRYINVVEYADDTAITSYAVTIRRAPVVCGDGLVMGAEECDDGNLVDTDACTNACLYGGVIDEVEPNGTTAEADGSAVQITDTTTIRGAISTVAELDMFKITAASATVLRMETFVGALGRCDSTTTVVRIYDSAGVLITSDTAGDASGISGCGALVLPVAAGTYYVRVEETGNNATIAKYYLQVAFGADLGAEAETVNTSGINDTAATASLNLVTTTEGFAFGDHTLLTDTDYYTITVPANSAVRLETVEGDRTAETCEALNVDSYLQVYGPDGTTSLATDDDDGRGYCSVLDGTGTSTTARDTALRNTTALPVTWYVRVRSSGTSGTLNQFSYRLLVTIRAL